ncbi:MAG: Asp-tRNA(Asn)/Glu-tRNA(Gln) amidotransferase subunit GatA [Candidatus Bathyarchaeota archaeon]|nr:Asp-tRNA(Asn)/Glu-tRNA(Gln) amidotransferase subunit GatA [Candidatus Bathyarchaeota archaeon]MCX8161592.1 Asp-tRNA(Asn)/Glu-tRNA(Gln) amidotransferase subunit GatA [Candidatus Bathyarchaeota archaeon]
MRETYTLKLIREIESGSLPLDEYLARKAEAIAKLEPLLNSFITIVKGFENYEAGKLGLLRGLTVAIKDNICVEGVETTCGSLILKGYRPSYDATVVERIKGNSGVITGKTNMDEFAMGSTTEWSAFGPTRNPWDPSRVPGGSSGGSAAAVASGESELALGSDTGGSIRCPASFCGVVGLKPTYGLVSRYGLIAYANSLEQIGPIARDVYGCALLLTVIAGYDPRDSTSIDRSSTDYRATLIDGLEGFRIGVIRELLGEGVDRRIRSSIRESIYKLESLGAVVEEISMPSIEFALPAYYIIAMAEASSNLARYDGVRYGMNLPVRDHDWSRYCEEVRSRGFGLEVKRRMILGAYVLSAGYYDRYYIKALKVRTLIKREFTDAFKTFDALIGPSMPILPFKIGEKVEDPLELYMCDMDTVPVNLAGLPAISIPCGLADGLPIGLQIIGSYFREDLILRVAYNLEATLDLRLKPVFSEVCL